MNKFKIGSTYFLSNPFIQNMYQEMVWTDCAEDQLYMSAGFVFHTKVDAIESAKEVLKTRIENRTKISDYPRAMLVWNNPNQHKQIRIVIGEVYGKFIAFDDDDVPFANATSLNTFIDLLNDRASFEVSIFDNAKTLTNLEQYLINRYVSREDIDVIRQLALNEE